MLSKLKQVKRNLFFRAFVFFLGFLLFFLNFLNYVRTSQALSAGSIVFVVDISNSMNVKDVFYWPNQTTRLELAKHIIKDNVEKLNNKFWLVVFSNKMDYLVPPTLDKDNFLTYLETINTNLLNWWKTDFKKSMEELKKVLNPMDVVVIFSDFDFSKNYKVKFNNLVYFVWVGSENWWIVKNKDGKTIFVDWQPVYSKLNKNILLNLAKDNYGNYLVIKQWKKWKILPFLEKIKPINSSYENKKINYSLITWFLLILLAL